MAEEEQPLVTVEVRRSTPGNGNGCGRLPAGKSLENCAFRCRETTDFDWHRVERTSSGRNLHPLKASNFSRRTVTPVSCKPCTATASPIGLVGPVLGGKRSVRSPIPKAVVDRTCANRLRSVAIRCLARNPLYAGSRFHRRRRASPHRNRPAYNAGHQDGQAAFV